MADQSVEQPKSQLQQDFDTLTEQKKALWAEIKDLNKGNYEYEQAPQWKEIQKLDSQLLVIRSKIEEASK